jgi:predicted hydrocarbon binding protein
MAETVEPALAKRRELQQVMNLLGAISSGLEQVVGRGAAGMSFTAGRTLGRQFSEGARRTADLEEALVEVRRVLQDNDCLWGFEVFRPQAQASAVTHASDGASEVQLVFRDCMIRQALLGYGHPQRGSLCTMMYGFFSGALENIMGRRAELQIVHAGENACLKRLRVMPAAPAGGAA